MLVFIFWLLIVLIIYCYFGYPLILKGLTFLFTKPVKRDIFEPSVSILISVWNEADVIKGKLRNLLALDYPEDKFEIIIGADGCTDKTIEIINSIDDPRIRCIAYSDRRGKMVTLNKLIKETTNDYIVFTDARQFFDKHAVRSLLSNFADSTVGCVSGELRFWEREGSTARGVNLYWRYEKFIRAQESKLGSMLGATGAIYAIRKSLYKEVPDHVVLDDMYVPLRIIEAGYRAVFDESAFVFDEVADNPKEEYRRKARTLSGNFQIFQIFWYMFIPFKSPIAVQLFSHKLLRIFVPVLMIVLFVLNLFMLVNPFYQMMFTLQILFYCAAFSGALARGKKNGILKLISRVCGLPYVFCLLNFSALSGLVRYLRGRQKVTWKKARNV
ncbi:MAG: biofilm PGA synthesis N-glycosyltransferase PgaC [Lysobacterales bacterium]|jgi:biofilm PGA synthesis N-glycosyltransferase PgaC